MNNSGAPPVEGFVTLSIPTEYRYLRMVRHSLTDLCVHAGLSEFKSAELEMAVDEACSRIIEHLTRKGSVKGTSIHDGLRINLIQQGDQVIVEIFDHGPELDFLAEESANPETFAKNPDGGSQGLGIYVIKKFVDEVTHEKDAQSGNVLRLIKRL